MFSILLDYYFSLEFFTMKMELTVLKYTYFKILQNFFDNDVFPKILPKFVATLAKFAHDLPKFVLLGIQECSFEYLMHCFRCNFAL